MYFGFRDVYVDYGKKEVLRGLSLDIPRGKVVTLIGQNGCGKSTLLKTVPKAVVPRGGEVVYFDKKLSSYPPKQLAQKIAYLSQVHESPPDIDVHTLVSYGRFPYSRFGRGMTADDGRIIDRALSLTGLTHLGDRILSTLSGGERQRISIARAFLKDAPIILLDEATASLDAENESLVQEALSKLIVDKTVMIIAHRMRTVANADHIVVLKDGVTAEQGSPDELYASDGIYRRMSDLQKESSEWQLK